jgi:hypothetical protein
VDRHFEPIMAPSVRPKYLPSLPPLNARPSSQHKNFLSVVDVADVAIQLSHAESVLGDGLL